MLQKARPLVMKGRNKKCGSSAKAMYDVAVSALQLALMRKPVSSLEQELGGQGMVEYDYVHPASHMKVAAMILLHEGNLMWWVPEWHCGVYDKAATAVDLPLAGGVTLVCRHRRYLWHPSQGHKGLYEILFSATDDGIVTCRLVPGGATIKLP